MLAPTVPGHEAGAQTEFTRLATVGLASLQASLAAS
jgi:hypothetical protein